MSRDTVLGFVRRYWPVVLLGLGWIGGQLTSPGTRFQRLEAQQYRTDSTLDAHVVWANTERNILLTRVNTLVRLKCMEDWDQPDSRRLLIAAGADCESLIGNRLPGVTP